MADQERHADAVNGLPSLALSSRALAQSVRVGWYFTLARGLEARASAHGQPSRSYKPVRPVPDQRALLAALGELIMADATAIRDGIYPAMSEAGDSPLDYARRVRRMFEDLPSAIDRRNNEDAASARTLADTADLPDYFTQDFHFQTGGYLTEDSAELYDVQVETLFMGSASLMRRAALRAVAATIVGRDQRKMTLLDIACGTGRFLRQARLAFPALSLTGLDLSRPYLAEAERQFVKSDLRAATWLHANAEKLPQPDASVDIVTSIFLFHELPPDVRRTVIAEMARVLKPGGTLIVMDSLQMGDKPGWDGLLESFPVRFHEPYFRHYAIDDLDAVFVAAGLESVATTLPFLSKLWVRRRV